MQRYQSTPQSQDRGTAERSAGRPTGQGETPTGQEGTPTGRQETRQSQLGAQRPGTTQQGSRRRPRTYRTAVGLPDETRRAVVEMLNQTLADTTDLMTQAKFAHWNVKGMNFYQLHLLFDEIAETLNEHIDIIAERATALGGEATGTVRIAASNSCIPEIPPDATTGPEYVAALVERVGIHANNLRADIEAAVEHDDEDTADLYTELSREVDKQLYFLEAHLQAVEPGAIPENPGASMQSRREAASQEATSQGGTPSQYRQSESHQGQGQQGQTSRGRTRRRQSYGRSQHWEQWG